MSVWLLFTSCLPGKIWWKPAFWLKRFGGYRQNTEKDLVEISRRKNQEEFVLLYPGKTYLCWQLRILNFRHDD